MKGIIQQKAPTGVPSAVAVKTVGQLKPRPGAGNRRRADNLEMQAEDLAARIMRGEKNLATRITRTTAAVPLNRESGSPLPHALRGAMELGLGADLGAVRIHAGGDADEAARKLDAEAFTSGRDIFFRTDRYAPYSRAGRALIAHELVHVLQQTGRVKTGGVIAATNVHGTSDVQPKRKSPLATSTSVPTFEEMSDRHARANPRDKALLAKIKQIKSEKASAEKGNRLESSWANLEQYVRSSPEEYDAKTSSQAVRAFVCDTLKLAGRKDGAIHLLSEDLDLPTTYFSAEIFEEFPEGPVPGVEKVTDYNEVFMGYWNVHPFFKKFRVNRFLETIRQYLLGPTRAIPDLEARNGEFDKLTSSKLDERNAPTELIDNELFFVSVDVVRSVNTVRVQLLSDAARAVSPGKRPNELTPRERALASGEFAKKAAALKGDTSRSVEVNYTLKALSNAMVEVAHAAQQFWSVAENLVGYSAQDLQFKGIGDIQAGLKRLAARPEVQKLGENVVAQAKVLFKLDPQGNPIGAEAYAEARDAFVKKLREKMYDRFEAPMLREFASGKPDGLLNALTYGWLLMQIYGLIEALGKYSIKEDEKVLAEYAKISEGYKGADVRVRHRREVAAFLSNFGPVLGWTGLEPILERVFTPAPGDKSLLAIFGDFKKDSTDLDQMTKDLTGAALLVGGEPLTVGAIRLFFLMRRYSIVSADLKASLEAERTKPGSQNYGIVGHALDLAKNLREPVRYTTQNFYASVRVQDADIFSPLLRVHPKYLALNQKLSQDGSKPILLTPTGVSGDTLIIWALPPLDSLSALIMRFKGIRQFNEAIYYYEAAKEGTRPVKDPDVSEIARRPWETWFNDFQSAVRYKFPWFDQTLDPDKRRKLYEEESKFLEAGAGVRTTLSGDTEAERVKMDELLRKASILDRSKKSQELNRLLGDYERYDQFTRGDETKMLRYVIPDAVLDEIVGAVHLTLPQEEQPLHQAALLLELADRMAEKFKDSPRFDIMVSYLPLMEQAIEVARKQTDALRTVLTEEEKKGDWVESRAKQLEKLSLQFHSLQQAKQLEFGLQGVISGSDKYLVGVGEGYVIKPGESFTIDGIKYTLIDILTNFIFHPKHGTEAPFLTDASDKPLKPSTALVQVKYGDSPKVVTLTGRDERDLTELSNAVTMEGIIRQLNDLAKYIEGFAELTMDALEFIPGAGQALMAARLAVSILQFLLSDEFKVLVDFVTNDPIGALKEFGKDILKLMNPSMLWDYLFFGNNAFDGLHATKSQKQAKTPKTVTEKMTRVIMRLYNFGKGVLGSLGRLQTHARWRAESLEVFVLGRPTLAWLVQKIADHIDYIAMLVGEAAEFGGSIDEYRQQANTAVKEWPARVVETVDSLKRFQLPDEIIPVADIVEIVVSMVLRYLPLKFRTAAKVIMFLLDKFGQKQAVFNAIADGVKEIGADPNIIWRDVRDDYLNKPFQAARNDLAFTIFDFFGRVPTTANLVPGQFTLMTTEQQKMFQDKAKEAQADTSFKPTNQDAEEWAAYTPAGVRPGRITAAQPAATGSPLPAGFRRRAEAGFGQSLAHVRLHTGDAASRFTASAGAQALAGGSHIFLGRGVSPSTPQGKWIVHHELAHVVEQTGSRASHPSSSTQPVPIPRGRGVLYDPSSESLASRAADAISAGKPFPLRSQKSRAGLQPFGIIDVTRHLLETLSGTTDLEKDEKKEEKTGGTTGLKKLPANIKKQIDTLWESFADTLGSAKTSFTAPFNDKEVKSSIIALLTNKADPEHAAKAIEEALGDLAIDSVREKKDPSAEKGKEAKIIYELDVDRLEVALSRFIFAKAGILIRFKLEASNVQDTPPTFKALDVVYVHLAEIHGNHKLWQMAVSTVLQGKDRDKYLPRIRTYLEGKGPVLGIWEKSTYQLTKKVIDDVEEIMAAVGSTLDKEKLPPPLKYLAPKKPADEPLNVGLRLGVYGDAEQKGTERESHHITQYLLLEYFHSKSDDHKPFPLIAKNTKAYPGVRASGSGSGARTDRVDGSPAIDLAGFEDGRGAKMPAILLAAHTHRTGRLHVTTKADDWTSGGDKMSAPDSPSGVVHMKFLGNLPDEYVKAQEKSLGKNTNPNQETFPGYVARVSGSTVQKTIHTAMEETYHWMRDFMQPRLENALVTAELTYYNSLGKEKGYAITADELKVVYAEAVAKNEAEMTKGGWI